MSHRTMSQVEHEGDRQGGKSTLQDCMTNSCTKVEQCVQSNPSTSMFVSLGAGLGVGLLIGSLLARSTADRWFREQRSQHLGERMLSQMGSWLPDQISDRLSS